MLPLERLENWLESPFESFPSYNAYTNRRFLSLERIDGIFWNNSKDFLIMYGPLTLVIFLLCFCLFRLFFNQPVSIFFRIYSFFWYLSELIFLANIEKLTFLAARHFQTLFSLTPGFRWMQAAFVLFGFFFLMQVVCLFFAYRS